MVENSERFCDVSLSDDGSLGADEFYDYEDEERRSNLDTMLSTLERALQDVEQSSYPMGLDLFTKEEKDKQHKIYLLYCSLSAVAAAVGLIAIVYSLDRKTSLDVKSIFSQISRSTITGNKT